MSLKFVVCETLRALCRLLSRNRVTNHSLLVPLCLNMTHRCRRGSDSDQTNRSMNVVCDLFGVCISSLLTSVPGDAVHCVHFHLEKLNTVCMYVYIKHRDKTPKDKMQKSFL